MTITLEEFSRILGRCIVMYIALALLWFALYLVGGVCSLGKMLDITEHECAVITYGGIGLLKILGLVFFVFPWFAIQGELRNRRNG